MITSLRSPVFKETDHGKCLTGEKKSDFWTRGNQELYTLGKMSLKSCQLFGKCQCYQPFITVLKKPKINKKHQLSKIFATPENSENVTNLVYAISD